MKVRLLIEPFKYNFSHITYLMSCMAYLNSTCRLFYESPYNGLEEIPLSWFGRKLGSF